MQSSAQETYLATHVTTATPQKLQLLLVEGAIRSIERTRQAWRVDQNETACEAVLRAQEIVGHILGGLKPDVDRALVSRVAAVYGFVYRCLIEANHLHDESKLDDALRVLEIERETWRQLCQQTASQTPTDSRAAQFSPAQSAATRAPAPPVPHLATSTDSWGSDGTPAPGLSLEA